MLGAKGSIPFSPFGSVPFGVRSPNFCDNRKDEDVGSFHPINLDPGESMRTQSLCLATVKGPLLGQAFLAIGSEYAYMSPQILADCFNLLHDCKKKAQISTLT